MAQHFLHGAQIARRLQHVRGERVAQHVRMHVGGDVRRQRMRLQAQLQYARRDARAARAEEQGGAAIGRWRAHGQPGAQGHEGRLADGHLAHLAALARDDDFEAVHVEPAQRGVLAIFRLAVMRVQTGQLGDAQAARIQQLEHGAVAQLLRFGAALLVRRGRDEAHGVIHRQGFRQGLGPLRGADAVDGIGVECRLAAEPVEEAAPRRQLAGDRARVEAAGVQLGRVAPHLIVRQRRPGRIAAQLQQGAQVASVGVQRMRRQLALRGQLGQVGVEPLGLAARRVHGWLRPANRRAGRPARRWPWRRYARGSRCPCWR